MTSKVVAHSCCAITLGTTQEVIVTLLYRGVSHAHYEMTGGLLLPKSCDPFEYCFRWGEEGLKWGSGATYGPSTNNAILRHQLLQAGFPTSGISMTPVVERAIFYATRGNQDPSGLVYEVDSDLLAEHGVRAYRVRDYATAPAIPADDEVILVADDSGALPMGIVVRVVEMSGQPVLPDDAPGS